jgi:hypothetical protein
MNLSCSSEGGRLKQFGNQEVIHGIRAETEGC